MELTSAFWNAQKTLIISSHETEAPTKFAVSSTQPNHVQITPWYNSATMREGKCFWSLNLPLEMKTNLKLATLRGIINFISLSLVPNGFLYSHSSDFGPNHWIQWLWCFGSLRCWWCCATRPFIIVFMLRTSWLHTKKIQNN